MTSASFPVPGAYAGDPPPAEGLRQALALATDAEVNLVMAMLVTAAKMLSGTGEDYASRPLTGAAALFGWLSAFALEETERRARLFAELGNGEG